MKKYFIHDGKEQKGAFDLAELKQLNVTKETPVWFEGLPNWKKAGEIPELQSLFVVTPPPFTGTTGSTAQNTTTNFQQQHQQQAGGANRPPQTPPLARPKKTTSTGMIVLWVSLSVIGVLAGVFIVAYIIKHNNSSGGGVSPTYELQVMSIEEQERANPAAFLKSDGTYRQTIFGQKFEVEGTITNNATVANYKDIVLEFVFYTRTKTVLSSEQYTIYEFVPHAQTKTFKFKIARPAAAASVGWNVVSATPY